MEGLAGSSLHESNCACYNCINGITSTAVEYNFTTYNCISNITICGRTVEEDYPTIILHTGRPKGREILAIMANACDSKSENENKMKKKELTHSYHKNYSEQTNYNGL